MKTLTKVACFALVLLAVESSNASVIWTDWTSRTLGINGAASGTLSSLTISYSGDVDSATQVSGGTNYWNPNTPYISPTVPNEPPASDIIALNQGANNVISFSQPVTNPVMAIVSLGQVPIPVSYFFDRPFDVLSFGPGYWGGPGTLTELPGNELHGVEGHGVIQFQGTFSTISWSVSTFENWHGFTIGLVPEPSMVALLTLMGTFARRSRIRLFRPTR